MTSLIGGGHLFSLPRDMGPIHACVIVLGDVGRSPRMNYHALSLAAMGPARVASVTLVGYRGAEVMEAVRSHERIRIVYVPEPVKWSSAPRSRLQFLLMAPFKVLLQLLCLVWTLFVLVARPDVILVQNPPSIPTLLLAQVLAVWSRARLVIDWHNFGYSLLAMRVGGQDHWLARFAKGYEQLFGRNAYAHLAVTEAMARKLADEWHVRSSSGGGGGGGKGSASSSVIVLHDKPPSHFRRLVADEIHAFLVRVQHSELKLNKPTAQETLLTRSASMIINSKVSVQLRSDRCALLVSGTSWTEDEDFSILLAALKEYAETAQQKPKLKLARLVVVVTGKGPLKEHYEQLFPKYEGAYVQLRTAWLSAEDYPRLLGCADLGVSLHTSSSGLDLPMKVVDMFGCGLPVCAVRFQCIDELVKHDTNGLVFGSAKELSSQLVDVFSRWNGDSPVLQRLSKGVEAFRQDTWQKNWESNAEALFSPHSR